MPPGTSPTVWLGLAGDWTHHGEELNHFCTKVGGLPCFPGQIAPCKAAQVSCLVCGAELSLVMQAHAPLEAYPERVLYLFACVKPGCGRKPGSWRAYSCHMHTTEQPAPPPAPQQALQPVQEQVHSETIPGFTDGFGDGDDDWGADSSDAAGAFDFSDLNSALDASAGQAAAAGGSSKHAKSAAPAPSSSTSELQGSIPTCTFDTSHLSQGPALLPEFHVHAAQEPAGKGSSGIKRQDKEHIAQLFQAYQQEEVEAGGGRMDLDLRSTATAGDSTDSEEEEEEEEDSGAAAHAEGQEEEDGEASADGEEDRTSSPAVPPTSKSKQGRIPGPSQGQEEGGWEPEQYEEDKVRGVESAYLRFSQRLERQPDQCARYCCGGAVLWPKKRKPKPESCLRCGKPKAFELQLMAAVISLILEAATYLADRDASGAGPSTSKADEVPRGVRLADPAAINGAANWDLCTVAVYTCQSKCCAGPAAGQGGAACWLEEQCVLVNEDECHTDDQRL